MPREKKDNKILGLSNSKFGDLDQNLSIEEKNIDKIELNFEENKEIDMKNVQKLKKNLPFKNPSFISKYKNKEKSIRTSKTPKNLVIDNIDSISLNICKYN